MSRSTSTSCDKNPAPLQSLKERFLQHLAVRNFSSATIQLRRSYLDRFLRWCDERGVTQLSELTREVLQSYQRHLFHRRNARTGKPLQFSTQVSLLTPVRAWFRYLVREGELNSNPAVDLDVPKTPQRLPTGVLSVEEAEQILGQPDIGTPLGLRDRALLETLYSTAIRRSELIHLSVYDLDLERGVVTVRQGKGRKDRIVPISERALKWVLKYVADTRPALVDRTGESLLFVSRSGRPLGGTNLSLMIRGYIEQAGVNKPGSCHLFRHAAATQMLENGADLRSLQVFLGHAKLTTTQLYTHISIAHLKKVHERTHPSAGVPQSASDTETGGDSDGPT